MTAEMQLPHAKEAAPLAATRQRMPIRYWIMAACLVAFWIFEFHIYTVEMEMFKRFISRMIVSASLLLVFLGWLLTNRYLLWRDRLLAIGWLVFGTAAAMFLAEKGSRPFVLLIGLPRLITALAVWLITAHSFSRGAQRLGLCAAAVLVLGYFDLVRCDGLDGAQRPKLSWRWSPTPEQLFLTSTTPTRSVSKGSTPTRSVSEGSTQARSAGEGSSATQQPATNPWTLQPGDWP